MNFSKIEINVFFTIKKNLVYRFELVSQYCLFLSV